MTASLLIVLSFFSLCNCQFLVPSANSSLITVTEFKELVDLIGEEKQLRHALEHNAATLQQQLSINEAAYKRLENDYKNLSQAYNSLRASKTDLQRQFAEMKLTNQSIQATLATTTAELSAFQRKLGLVSAFTATNPNTTHPSGYVRFNNVLSNIGSDYSSSTGAFTCQYPGIYIFTTHLYNSPSSSYDYVSCFILLNGSNRIRIYSYPYSDTRYYEASNSLIIHLKAGDTISVGGCSSSTGLYTYSSFSGFLIKLD